MSLGAELAAPLALVHSRARAILVPCLFFMQVGIALVMNTHPRSPNFVCYAFWVPWDRLGALFPARAGPVRAGVGDGSTRDPGHRDSGGA